MEYDSVLDIQQRMSTGSGITVAILFGIPLILVGLYLLKQHISKIKGKKFITHTGNICDSENNYNQETESYDFTPVIEYSINGITYKKALNVTKTKKGKVKFKYNIYNPEEIMSFGEYYGYFIVLLIGLFFMTFAFGEKYMLICAVSGALIGGFWGLNILLKDFLKAHSSRYLETEGEVVEVKDVSRRVSEDPFVFSEQIVYTVDGKRYFLESSVAGTGHMRKGTICTIKYNPENPYDSVIKKDWRRTILVIVMVPFYILGVYLIFKKFFLMG